MEFVGIAMICCEKSNLIATIDFKGKGFLGISGTQHAVSGTIRTLDTDELLYEIDGVWDQEINLINVKTKEKRVLFDYEKAKEFTMTVQLPAEETLEPNNSLSVWKKCSEAIWKKDARGANDAKRAVEELQRKERKEREEKGEKWEPSFFDVHPSGTGYILGEKWLDAIPNAHSRSKLPTNVSPLISRIDNGPAQLSRQSSDSTSTITRRMGKFLKGGLK